MANTLITPSIIAKVGLATLWNNMVLAGLVWRDFDPDFRGNQGDTITIRKPAIFTANTFNRASGITIQDAVEQSMPLTLNTIADVSFAITSEDLTLKLDDFAGRLLNPAIMAIVEKVDTDLANALVNASAAGGGGGSVTGTSGPDALIKARESLTRKKLPVGERSVVLSPESVSLALGQDLFVAADKSGSTDGLRNANVGRAFGMDTYESGTYGYGAGVKGQADGVAFHKTAVTLASRALQAPTGVAPSQVAIENYQGLALRVVQSYDITKKQDVVSVDFLYGIGQTRPEGAVKINLGLGS